MIYQAPALQANVIVTVTIPVYRTVMTIDDVIDSFDVHAYDILEEFGKQVTEAIASKRLHRVAVVDIDSLQLYNDEEV